MILRISILLKRIISIFLFHSGVFGNRISKYAKSGQICILMYHRVIPPVETIQAGMYVKPGTFENQLKLLKKYFNVISLDKLGVLQKENLANSSNKPPCVITFDDGWKDFYDFAYPLLKKYNFPATIFLPTKFIDSRTKFWTDTFAYLIANRQITFFNQLSEPENLEIIEYLNKLSGSIGHQLEAGIEYLKKYPLSKIEEILAELSHMWQVDTDKSGRDFLNWSEIIEMKNSGLVSFGSHTVNHHILTTVDDETIKSELVDSREELLEKNVLDGSCLSFCYPNGSYTKDIAAMVRSSGYHLAVTTKNGWNQADADKFTLKRIGIHEDMTSTDALFACRIAGLI